MSREPLAPAAHYLAAIAAVLLATALRWLLAPLLGNEYPLFTFCVAVAVVGWWWGWRPAVLASALGYAFGAAFFLGELSTTAHALQFAMYAALSALLIGLTHYAWRAHMQAQQRERELKSALDEIEAIVRHAPVGILVAREPTLATMTANAYVEQMLGAPAGANLSHAAGQPHAAYRMIRAGQLLDPSQTPMRRAVASGRPVLNEVLQLIPANGTTLDVIVSAVPLLDDAGRPRGAIGTVQNVTQLNAVERELRASERRFRDFADSIPSLAWLAEPDGAVTFLNRGWYEYTGQSPQDAMPRGWRQALHPEDLEASTATWHASRDRGEPLTLEYRIRRADGAYRWFLNRAVPQRDELGRVVQWYGTCTDIHDAKTTEQLLRAQEEALRDADRRKDEFLATLAHELRNPLAPIRYATRLLKPGTPPEMAEDARRMIDRQLGHMARLLDDLLDVSRITRGVLELRSDTLDLRDIVERAVATARPLIEAVNHELDLQLAREPVPIEGDATRLQQVIGNLLDNAAKYSDPGGRISVECGIDGAAAFVRVSDTGHGIEPEWLPKIFGLFVQAERVGQVAGGLGIGLALVRQLVEMHGGSIEASSPGRGGGSTFTIRLPRSVERPAVAERAGPGAAVIAPLHADRIKVLVVDDNRDAAQSLEQMLTLAGYSTRVAYDGIAAAEVAELMRPHVVLLDIGLPGLDGYGVARHIRAQPWGLATRLLAITGWGHDADRAQARAAGFDEHLTKPVDPDALIALIARMTLPVAS